MTTKEKTIDDSRLKTELTIDALKIQDPEKVCKEIEQFIRSKVEELNRDGIIIGLSGGIDSVVAVSLCVRAVGADNVTALYMPDIDSDRRHGIAAENIAKKLKIRFETIDITPVLKTLGIYKLIPSKILSSKKIAAGLYKSYYAVSTKVLGQDKFGESLGGSNNVFVGKGNAYAKTKHRIRMVILYKYATIKNFLVVGAANKTEAQIGFFAKWGVDHSNDIMPIGNLYKCQIRQLAEHLGIAKEIIRKPPSPDLIPGFTDEMAVGRYDEIDIVLFALENRWPIAEISSQSGISTKRINQIMGWMKKSAHMRESPYLPGI